jgi:D-proline reductase (dithiol) PrdB
VDEGELPVSKAVDSYHFIGGITKRLVKTWIQKEPVRDIPWTPLPNPLSACTVALISTGGIALRSDRPFDQEGERENPWWGDPSYRVVPNTATARDIRVYHQHIDPSFAEQDLNCLLPLERLAELAEAGEIGRVAPSHYSFMGYLLQPQQFLEETVPAVIHRLRDEVVDLVVLVPV